ncbi:MAG TPA: GNAT family acetyltransferase [Verrucomicrobiae bacterium]|nr:GNAT family acetyltransferase [Verrucomicrobiae bacterium]
MTSFQIRPYRPADEAAVLELWKTCQLVGPKNNPRQDIARKLLVNPEWFLVGELDSKIVATCMVGYEGHRGWINYLAVAPEYQRRGFARQIMEEAERLLREVGCPKINLQVRTANAQVIEFYKSIGFKVDDVVSMGKRLETDEPFHSPDIS